MIPEYQRMIIQFNQLDDAAACNRRVSKYSLQLKYEEEWKAASMQ